MNMDFSEEAQKTVVTAYKMGFEAADEKYKAAKLRHEKLEEIFTKELAAAEENAEKYRAALQKVMDDCKWWSKDNWCGGVGCPCHIALRALEVNDGRA